MRRERSNPTERHATSRVIAVFRWVVVVPLRLPPFGEREWIRFASIAGAIGVGDGSREVLSAGPRPNPAKVRFAIRQTRGWRLHIDFSFQ